MPVRLGLLIVSRELRRLSVSRVPRPGIEKEVHMNVY